MSNDKAIKHGKEHRKPYRRAQAVAKFCRCNGGCPYCEGNRLYNSKRKEEMVEDKLKEYEEDEEIGDNKD